jgi:protein phosphatase inhibitor 2
LEQGRTNNPCPVVAFEEHRKVHYDEYHKMKELLQKGTMTDDGDENESEPDDKSKE